MQTADCTCAQCVAACKHAPGWMSPEDARKAISAGYASKLMLEYYLREEGNIYVLCPASVGREGWRAPNTHEMFNIEAKPGSALAVASLLALVLSPATPETGSKGQCVFLQDERCAVHNSGFKPIQCADSRACTNEGPNNDTTAALWDNPEAQTLVREWIALVGITEAVFEGCY